MLATPCSSPCFSGDGKYLFFVSNRDFNPIYSSTEWNHAYQDMARIYFITLNKDVANPFKPKSDETAAAAEKPKADEPKKDPKEPIKLKIDLDGIKDRIMALPIAVGATPVALSLVPRLSRMTAPGQAGLFRDTYIRGLAVPTFLAVPAAILLAISVVVPKQFLTLVFGAKLSGAAPAFATLVVAMMFLSLTVLITNYLFGTGSRWIVLLLAGGSALAAGLISDANGHIVATARADLAAQAVLAEKG